ncbi:MAG: glycosyltransferase [Thermodesulfobacteriota bacterium]
MKKRLKILHVAPYYYPAWSYGGIPRVVYELTTELARRGHDVTVCTTDVLDSSSRYGVKGREATVDGVKVHYFRNLSNRLAYRYQLFMPTGLRRFVAANISRFDVVHLNGHRNLLNNVVRRHALRAARPYLLSAHGTVARFERRILAKVVFDKVLGDRVLRDAAGFVAVSGAEVRRYEEMGVDRQRVTVIHNGLDPGSFKDLPLAGRFKKARGLEGRRIILFLGKITPAKGVDVLVRAFARLDDASAFLVIAGNDMGFKGRVEEISRECGVEGRVLFTGLITGEEKLAAYRDADVVAYPASNEIFGLVPFEAMMCGTPVIVADDSGCGEIIGGEGIGRVVRYGDVEELKGAVSEVLSGGGDDLEMVERGKRFIVEKLSWARAAERHERLYRSLLKGEAR